jgi:hypothetical protein
MGSVCMRFVYWYAVSIGYLDTDIGWAVIWPESRPCDRYRELGEWASWDGMEWNGSILSFARSPTVGDVQQMFILSC